MEHARHCAEAITAAELRDLAALSRPHPVVREVVETTLMLLSYQNTKWSAAQACFEDPEPFLERLHNFDASQHVSRLQYQKLCRGLAGQLGAFAEGHAESLAPASGGFASWCRAVYNVLAWRFGGPPLEARLCRGAILRSRSLEVPSPSRCGPTASRGSGSPGGVGGSGAGGGASGRGSHRPPRGSGDAGTGGAPASGTETFSSQSRRSPPTHRGAQAPARGCEEEEEGSEPVPSTATPSTPPTFLGGLVARPELGDLEVIPDIYAMPIAELRRVRDLTIRRARYGEVTFTGEIDLLRDRRVLEELPKIIRLEPGEVVLYPDAGTKPPEGEGLNRPATITLFQCMPPNGGHFDSLESKTRYRNSIAHMTELKGAHFVDYDCDHGVWQFRVDHF